MRIIEERSLKSPLEWGAEVGSLYQLFVEVVVPFEGSVARKRKEEVRNYQITDDEPQKKPLTSQTLRPLCPLSVVRCGHVVEQGSRSLQLD